MHYSLRTFEQSEVAQRRLRIIEFYERYGERATKDAFGVDRKLISRWRQRLRASGGRLAALVPYSTRPFHLRHSPVPLEIVEFIRVMRENHPRIGKEKLKVLLDRFCQQRGIRPVSVSTIGNIISRHKFFYQPSGRVYHNPDSKWAQRRGQRRRNRIRYPIRPREAGHIVADVVELVIAGVRFYFYSAIDAQTKFALTLLYSRLTARDMRDFYLRFKQVYPGRIKSWQSDNGKENLGEFDEQLRKDGVEHYFSYPRCPKINTYIERYNRTIQEEFINYHLDALTDPARFNHLLADYLVFYNTERPHISLGLKSPMEYLLGNGKMSQMYLTHTQTLTKFFLTRKIGRG